MSFQLVEGYCIEQSAAFQCCMHLYLYVYTCDMWYCVFVRFCVCISMNLDCVMVLLLWSCLGCSLRVEGKLRQVQ